MAHWPEDTQATSGRNIDDIRRDFGNDEVAVPHLHPKDIVQGYLAEQMEIADRNVQKRDAAVREAQDEVSRRISHLEDAIDTYNSINMAYQAFLGSDVPEKVTVHHAQREGTQVHHVMSDGSVRRGNIPN